MRKPLANDLKSLRGEAPREQNMQNILLSAHSLKLADKRELYARKGGNGDPDLEDESNYLMLDDGHRK